MVRGEDGSVQPRTVCDRAVPRSDIVPDEKLWSRQPHQQLESYAGVRRCELQRYSQKIGTHLFFLVHLYVSASRTFG